MMNVALQTVQLTADRQVIRAYGELTDDLNPIHLDPGFAANTPMGRCIAHGTMSICLLWQSLFRSIELEADQHIDLDVRFVKPIFVGETICAGGKLLSDGGGYAVWVRGTDGIDRVTGTARVLTGTEPT